MAGTGIMEQMAAEGMKLFEPETGPVEVDKAAAEKFKEEVDAQIAALDAHIATLTGKENKKERTAKSKEASDLKVGKQYIDACKVVKGLEPKNGFFIVVGQAKPQAEAPKKEETEPAAAAAEVKKEKKEKAKKEENAGISPAERSELEQLKKDIIERKSQLKAEGMSGGQQNKDAQVVQWVARMNELKEKECPGSTQKDDKKEAKKKSSAPLSSEEAKELDTLRGEVETYKHRLKTEFGYSNKDIKADQDLIDMEKRLAELDKRS
jgi:hypothetical protein